MPRAFDPALPLERPLADSLTIYGKRLAILLGVALANAALLAVLWLNARSPIFSALVVSTAVIAAFSGFYLRTKRILLGRGHEKFGEPLKS